jgi:hypothetical protein
VKDDSSHGGFFVQKAGRKPRAIAGITFTGTRTVSVNLTAGAWTFFSTKGPAKTFTVSV